MKNTNKQLNTRVTSDIALFMAYQTPNIGGSAKIAGTSRCVMRI